MLRTERFIIVAAPIDSTDNYTYESFVLTFSSSVETENAIRSLLNGTFKGAEEWYREYTIFSVIDTIACKAWKEVSWDYWNITGYGRYDAYVRGLIGEDARETRNTTVRKETYEEANNISYLFHMENIEHSHMISCEKVGRYERHDYALDIFAHLRKLP